MSDIVGSSNEVEVKIGSVITTALLDTGSCVRIVSKSFYESNFQNVELLPIDGILKLECADGNFMSYLGYIQAEVQSIGIPTDHVQDCILLVVPDTDYHNKVPVLLGTNVLAEFLKTCKQTLGENFLQNAALHTCWCLAFRCMVIRGRELKKYKNRLAIVRSAESKNITIPSNSTVTIQGVTSKELEYQPTCAMFTETEDSVIPGDFDITPAVITYTYGKNGLVEVQISNVTTSTLIIPPRAILCELQPVSVDMTYQLSKSEEPSESVLNKVSVETDGISETEKQSIYDLLQKHEDIFFYC